jgi:hypothetical protein
MRRAEQWAGVAALQFRFVWSLAKEAEELEKT